MRGVSCRLKLLVRVTLQAVESTSRALGRAAASPYLFVFSPRMNDSHLFEGGDILA